MTELQPPFYLGIDVGGTNTKAGIVDSQARVLCKSSVSTQALKGPEHGISNFERLSRLLLDESGLKIDDIQGIGLATPGTMDIPGGMLLDPPNLPGWNDFPIRQRCEEALGRPTILQNDANAAAYGEFWAGAGRDANSLVFWTLGTGIGSGIIIDDLIIEGAHSHGAECGHIIIEMHNGRLCGTGQYGTLEAYAGAKALVLRCKEELATGRTSSIPDRMKAGEELTPLLIAQAAETGDELALELILELARCLGVGTVTVMHTIDPEMVLFGGAMTFGASGSPLGRRFLEEIRQEVKKRTFPTLAEKTIIDFASLGGDAGFIGAAGCAKRKFGQS